MGVKIKVPTQLRGLVSGQAEVVVDGAETVGDLFDKLRGEHPQLIERVLDDSGEIRRFINVYVGDEDVRFLDGLETKLEGADSVSILPAVAGGCAG